MGKRAAGILMPISSLPSDYGIGCFSKSAYEFVDWLKEAGQTYWQILPLGPTSYGDSPYQSFSTFAGNPYFIDLDTLVEEGVLDKKDCEKVNWGKKPEEVDYEKIYKGRRDDKGDIQLYVRRDELGDDAYVAFKKLDVGDIIGVKGEVFRTKTGELSARAEEITLLAKSLRPLPEKFHGLTDTEMRYRQRYVDLIANPEVKETFVKRSQILKEIRAYLDEKGFLEVDTPILTPFEIGASARPFYTHHNSLNMDMVLRIETELYLKRLIVGGMDRVYEVGRIFRNEGMDPKHNPEFTSIELYQAFTDFHGMMDLVEELYKRLAQKICGSLVIPYQGKQIDMGHWERLTMIEAVKKYSGVDFNDWKTDEDAIAAAKEHHVELPEVPTKGAILAEFFDAFVEDKLIQPTFIYDYPVEISPLAKRKPDDPAFTERFEYFIDCTEYGNAFSELNDPIDQKGRFERQVAERKAIEPDCKAQVDYDYVNALEYGLPPTGGLGFGVDRLVMLLTDSASIRDVLLFPTMKPIEQ